jgi:hypothetical protein
MKSLLVISLIGAAAASGSASQGVLGRAANDRDRHEALQHYRVGQDALRS